MAIQRCRFHITDFTRHQWIKPTWHCRRAHATGDHFGSAQRGNSTTLGPRPLTALRGGMASRESVHCFTPVAKPTACDSIILGRVQPVLGCHTGGVWLYMPANPPSSSLNAAAQMPDGPPRPSHRYCGIHHTRCMLTTTAECGVTCRPPHAAVPQHDDAVT
jgi:hypothetical protein